MSNTFFNENHNQERGYLSHRNEIDNIQKRIKQPFTCQQYACSSKYALTRRVDNNFNIHITSINDLKLQQGDRIFLEPDQVSSIVWKKFYNECKNKNITLNFIILKEPDINNKILNILLEISENIFLINNERIEYNPKIHLIPIAWRDGAVPKWLNHGDFTEQLIVDEGKKECNKNILCLLSFSPATNPERKIVINKLGDKDYIKNSIKNPPVMDNNKKYKLLPNVKIPPELFLEEIHSSKYVLDPRGCGVSTHRFWESIYLDAIPVVKKTNTQFDRLYNFYPCLIINDWDDVTEELLLNNYQKYFDKITNFKKQFPDFFTNVERVIEISKNYT